MKLDELNECISTNEKLLNFLLDLKLLKGSTVCECGSNMKWCADGKLQDGYILRCEVRYCRKKMSIRRNSFFQKSRMSMKKIIILINLWANNYPQNAILEEYDYSRSTVVEWFRFCRNVCCFDIEQKQFGKIGGVGKVVEIDETLIIKRKYDQLLHEQWLFGGIERSTDGFHYFVEFVNNKEKETLEEIIQRKIMPGTRIVSDNCNAYSGLIGLGYDHEVILHKDNSWLQLKTFLREKGKHIHNEWEYICEYLFRKEYKDVFSTLINKINIVYP